MMQFLSLPPSMLVLRVGIKGMMRAVWVVLARCHSRLCIVATQFGRCRRLPMLRVSVDVVARPAVVVVFSVAIRQV